MRELNMYEVEEVSGGDTNWQAVGTTVGLSALAVAAAPAYPVAGTAAAAGAAATGVYSAVDSYY